MTDNITLPREVVKFVLQHLERWSDDEPGKQEAIAALRTALAAIAALRTALAALAAEPTKQESVESDDDEEFTRQDVTTLLLEVMDWTYAKAHRNRPMTEAEQKVLNDIRTALAAEPVKPITVPKTVPLPPITCGFVDVRFDGERWFCDKCGKRMSADFETSVKRESSEKCYLELMQRKAEAVRTMSERNMK